MTFSPIATVLTSRSREFCSSCSISLAMRSMSAADTGRFSQERWMPRSTLLRSKLWRLPSFLITTMGKYSTVS